MASLDTKNSSPNKMVAPDLVTLTNTPTDLTTTDTWVFQVTLVNKTAGAVTVTVHDKATSAKSLLEAVSIAANTSYVIAFPEGQFMKGGLTWSASANSSIDAGIVAFYRTS